jgi:hypothetical protein
MASETVPVIFFVCCTAVGSGDVLLPAYSEDEYPDKAIVHSPASSVFLLKNRFIRSLFSYNSKDILSVLVVSSCKDTFIF